MPNSSLGLWVPLHPADLTFSRVFSSAARAASFFYPFAASFGMLRLIGGLPGAARFWFLSTLFFHWQSNGDANSRKCPSFKFLCSSSPLVLTVLILLPFFVQVSRADDGFSPFYFLDNSFPLFFLTYWLLFFWVRLFACSLPPWRPGVPCYRRVC